MYDAELCALAAKSELSTLSTELSTEKALETPILWGFQQSIVDNLTGISTYPQRFAQLCRLCPHFFPRFFHEIYKKCV
jgi:hypothetical protein